MNTLLFRGNEFDANFFYFSKIDVDNSFYLNLNGKRMLFVPKLNERAAKSSFNGQVIVYKKPLEEIAKLLKAKKMKLDYSALPAKIYEKLRRVCKPTDSSSEFLNIRAKKKPEEISKIKKAVSFTKKIISEIDLDEFKTEEDLRSWLVFQAYKKGGLAFDPIVASGKNSSFPHYKPKAGKIRDFTLIDFGVRCGNYCSDITRVLFSKRNRKVENAYEELQQVFYEILDEFPNFKTGKQVALFSEKLFEKYKLPKPIHSIGHGVGLDIHEFPRLNKKYSDPIKGAVMAIEPAAYFKDFGVRFENTIYFDGKKVQVL